MSELKQHIGKMVNIFLYNDNTLLARCYGKLISHDMQRFFVVGSDGELVIDSEYVVQKSMTRQGFIPTFEISI